MSGARLARIAQVWVFPVKSMAGTQVPEAEVVAGGLAGDRSWAVVGADGDPVTAADEPRLREVVPHLVDGELRLDVPGARPGLDPDAAAAALSDWLGRPVRLVHRDGTGFVDVAPVHVVSSTSVTDAEHAEDCDACDITAPRANLVLDLDPAAGSERDWVGRTVRAGAASLRVVRQPKHCLGVYADVTLAGAVRPGDDVTLA
jgi:hypothetical protein